MISFSVCNRSYPREDTCHLVGMDKNLGNSDLSASDINAKAQIIKTNAGPRNGSNKCNQCDYVSFHRGNLRAHMKTHSGEKSYKCSQCNYSSCTARSLRVHVMAHSGEKNNKCNQCGFASSYTGNLRVHMKTA